MKHLRLVNRLDRISYKTQVVFFILVLFSGCRQEHEERVVIANPLDIKVVGKDFYWHFIYPGPDLILGTRDDIEVSKDLVVPVGYSVRLLITSEDYIYFFRVPDFDLRESAIPDLIHEIEFVPDRIGVSELEVDPMCSAWAIHKDGSMGEMHILTENGFKNWLDKRIQRK